MIGRFMSFLVMWNLGRASKGPRNKHLDNSIVRFRLPSSAESSTTIPILRPAMQPASEAAGLRVRGPAGGANTTGNGRNSSDNVQQNHQQGALRSLLGRNKTQPPTEMGEKKTIERHPSPCRSAIVVRKIASPSNTASGQGPELAGVLQCNGSTSHDSVIGHSPWKGCIQGTEHASSARRRPPASCARCDRLRPACRR